MSALIAIARLRSVALLVAGMMVANLASACGEDDETTVAGGGDVERYCQIATVELPAEVQEILREIRRNPKLLNRENAIGERRLLQRNRDLYAELEEVVPPEIADESKLIVADARSRAGLSKQLFDPAAVEEARSVVAEFEAENCGTAN